MCYIGCCKVCFSSYLLLINTLKFIVALAVVFLSRSLSEPIVRATNHNYINYASKINSVFGSSRIAIDLEMIEPLSLEIESSI